MKIIGRILFLLLLLCTWRVHACEHGYPKTAQGVVNAYLKEDFTRGSNYWERISQFTLWGDAPGWDVTVLVSGYQIKGSTVTAERAEVEVEYSRPTNFSYEEAGPVVDHLRDPEIVKFKLVSRDGCWKILGPQNPPHLDARYIIEDLSKPGAMPSRSSDRYAKALNRLLKYYKK